MSFNSSKDLQKKSFRYLLAEYVPMVLVAGLIIWFAVLRQQAFYKTLPTLVTLVVQILMAKANRYGFLLGGFNAALYGVGYFSEGLYFSAASAALFSFPMQIWSFFHWKKHSEGNLVEFRIMPRWKTALSVFGILAGWIGCLLFLRPQFEGAVYPEMDAYLFVSGIVVTVLMAVRYLEAQYLNLIAGILSVVMWILIVIKDPSDMNFLIISVYNVLRTAEACIRWTVQYVKQRKIKKEDAK
jgi:nicotinamide mononucleotide transporter PnuC